MGEIVQMPVPCEGHKDIAAAKQNDRDKNTVHCFHTLHNMFNICLRYYFQHLRVLLSIPQIFHPNKTFPNTPKEPNP